MEKEFVDKCNAGESFEDFESAMNRLEEHARTMHRTNFALLMENDGLYKVYPRPNQPCQGGEMRKYKSTHKERCTRPNDRRPGDLRMPFPDGKPLAVGVHFSGYPYPYPQPNDIEIYNNYIDAVYGPDSPYLRGFNSPDSVRRLTDDRGQYVGLIFTDTKIDPTVFVNSLQYLRSCNHLTFDCLLSWGFTVREALAIMMLGQGINLNKNTTNPQFIVQSTNTYYFSASASLRRIFEADPNDLSGGTFYDGYDYNRPDIQHLFKASKNELALNFGGEFNKMFKKKYNMDQYTSSGYNIKYNLTKDRFIEVIREIFQKYYYDNDGLRESLDQKEAA